MGKAHYLPAPESADDELGAIHQHLAPTLRVAQHTLESLKDKHIEGSLVARLKQVLFVGRRCFGRREICQELPGGCGMLRFGRDEPDQQGRLLVLIPPVRPQLNVKRLI